MRSVSLPAPMGHASFGTLCKYLGWVGRTAQHLEKPKHCQHSTEHKQRSRGGCFSRFSHCCDKIFHKSNLRNKGFILARGLTIQSITVGRHGSRSLRRLSVILWMSAVRRETNACDTWLAFSLKGFFVFVLVCVALVLFLHV